MTPDPPRVGVLVVAYNAASTLEQTLSRLPQAFAESVDTVLVCDDASHDDTYEVGLRFRDRAAFPVTVVKHEHNLGYGGNQKAGYRWAQEHGLDVVVLLHGDGQYAPECIEDLVGPLVRGEADAVFGSRMLDRGSARAGGMPAYKYVGNRILTTFQNAMTGQRLSEWHSGYRAYRVDALRALDLESYSDGFDFDTEIILGLVRARKHITEVSIPTFYGDEICYVNGLQYARDVVVDVLRHWAEERRRPGRPVLHEAPAPRARRRTSRRRGATVLTVGLGDGRFDRRAAGPGQVAVLERRQVELDGIAETG